MFTINIDMTVIPEPEWSIKAIIRAVEGFTDPFFAGEGNAAYRCGSCQHVLMRNMRLGQIKNVILQCPTCKSYNEIPSAGPKGTLRPSTH